MFNYFQTSPWNIVNLLVNLLGGKFFKLIYAQVYVEAITLFGLFLPFNLYDNSKVIKTSNYFWLFVKISLVFHIFKYIHYI